MEIVEDFDEKSYNNNGKSWKSSRILRVNPKFFIFLSFSSFFQFCSFSSFFHFCLCFSSSFFRFFFFSKNFSFFCVFQFFPSLFFFCCITKVSIILCRCTRACRPATSGRGAGRRRWALPQTAGRAPAGRWVLPELGRVVRLEPTSRPCPSSS